VRIVGAALANGRRIVGYPHDAAQYLAYYMTHDAITAGRSCSSPAKWVTPSASRP
jgi:hypothetical protein